MTVPEQAIDCTNFYRMSGHSRQTPHNVNGTQFNMLLHTLQAHEHVDTHWATRHMGSRETSQAHERVDAHCTTRATTTMSTVG